MQPLKITIVQAPLVWQDIDANLAAFDGRLDGIRDTHIVVLPEMFTTGFSMKAPELAETMEGRSVHWLCDRATRYGFDVIGSMIIKEHDRYYNRLLWAQPDGTLHRYDKRHLFRMAGEERIYSPGTEQLTVAHRGWNVRPYVCYDLRFPAWTRNMNNAYDVAIFIANWPERRATHWRTLLQARAIENQCYVVGVNRVGEDGNGIAHSGDSAVVDPMGNVLFQVSQRPCVQTVALDYALLQEYRAAFPAWRDADRFALEL